VTAEGADRALGDPHLMHLVGTVGKGAQRACWYMCASGVSVE
jgi:hypothetical protein